MNTPEEHDAVDNLITTMARLRSPQGCQWDREQTPESLKPYILEETYELLEAIDSGDPQEICDELGDLLLQVVFQAQIFSEQGVFTMQDVAAAINAKLIRRHPHIFADADFAGHEQRWEEIKLRERSERGQPNNLSDRIPKTLPALKQAGKLNKKYSFTETSRIFSEVEHQLDQLKRCVLESPQSSPGIENSLGQLLFSLVALAERNGIDAEETLRKITRQKICEADNRNEVP